MTRILGCKLVSEEEGYSIPLVITILQAHYYFPVESHLQFAKERGSRSPTLDGGGDKNNQTLQTMRRMEQMVTYISDGERKSFKLEN